MTPLAPQLDPLTISLTSCCVYDCFCFSFAAPESGLMKGEFSGIVRNSSVLLLRAEPGRALTGWRLVDAVVSLFGKETSTAPFPCSDLPITVDIGEGLVI